MDYIVLDLEWNQPYNTKAVMVGGNMQLHGEIIQIGAVRLNGSFDMLSEFKIMISPKYYKKMHEYVARITKITTEELRNGASFTEAFYAFKQWCGNDFVFLTWGPDDVGILRENMTAYGIDTDWVPETYDAQMIFAHQVMKKKQQVSLTSAMEMMGEPAFKAHDALNDAKSAAVVCRHLDMEKGIGDYRATMDDLQCRGGGEGFIDDQREYSSKKMLFTDTGFTSFECPYCGSRAECTGFIRQNAEKYISIGRCEKGDEMLVRFKFKRTGRKKYRVFRIIHNMNEENKEYYQKKQEKKGIRREAGNS